MRVGGRGDELKSEYAVADEVLPDLGHGQRAFGKFDTEVLIFNCAIGFVGLPVQFLAFSGVISSLRSTWL